MHPTVFILGQAEQFANYAQAVKAAGGQVRFSEDPADAAECGALLLPGGGDLEPWRYGQANIASRGLEPERDRGEFALLDLFTCLRNPVLGICRGLQTINVYFGGTLAQDIPGHGQEAGADRVHGVRTAPSFREAFGGNTVNSAHHQAAERLGSGLRALQWARDGVVEALGHQALPVWGVQWHPERMSGGGALIGWFLEKCREWTERK